MVDEKLNHLKYGVLLLIENQEELNMLAEVTEMVDDCLHIDEPYLAFMEEVLMIVPQSKLEVGHFMESVKPRSFMPWCRSIKRKMDG